MVHFDEIEKINPLKIPEIMNIFKDTFKNINDYNEIDNKLKILATVNLPSQLILDGIFDIIDDIETIDWYDKNEVKSINRLANFMELADSIVNEYTIFTDYRRNMYEIIITTFFRTFKKCHSPRACYNLLHGYIRPEEV